MVRRRVIVSGRVQGVFFRDTCRHIAEAEGVAGFVRNMSDGRVEACFEGQEDAVARLVEWCRQGPRYAQVTRVDVIEEQPDGVRGFQITW